MRLRTDANPRPRQGCALEPLMTRRPIPLFAALALFACGLQAAQAGEAFARRVIGFSPDGDTFAVEEFGRGDPGMGNLDLHSFITFLDTRTNQALDDSVEVTVKGGAETQLAAVRSLAAQAAAASLRAGKIGVQGRPIGADASSRAGEQIFYLDVWTVEKASKTSLDVEAPELGGKARLTLDYAAPASTGTDAEPSSETPPSFVLVLTKPDGTRLAATASLADPWATDRGAFYKYAIAEARLMPRPGKTPVIGVLVQTFTSGAEGPNRNFIPVAIEVPATTP